MVIALDIGASKIRIAEVSKTNIKNKIELENPRNQEKIKLILVKFISLYLEKIKTKEICVGIAGMQVNGFIKNSPNMNLHNFNLKKFLQEKFKIKVFVENDARCAGLGEKYFGCGKEKKDFFLLTLGTGIGGALFVNGDSYSGKGIGFEPGHMLVNGKELEKIASGKASEKIAGKYGFRNINSFKLEELAKNGNKKAISVYKEIGKNLGIGLLNLSYVFDPEIIILAGGFAKVKFFWPAMLEFLHKNDLAKRNIKVVHAKLGDDAGLVGAGLLSSLKSY
ncbi:ROK family protein [Candidatus Pacearchaeota archaeon]|nr:ROK family protein [Candidatus Pacearchaeota archaeon]